MALLEPELLLLLEDFISFGLHSLLHPRACCGMGSGEVAVEQEPIQMGCWVASVVQLLGVTDTVVEFLSSSSSSQDPPHPFSPHHGMTMTGIPHVFGFQVWHCQGRGRC